MSGFLNRKIKGFNGITHVLITANLLLLIILLSRYWSPLGELLEDVILQRRYMAVLVFVVLGGSLFPDLDSNRSTAVFRLGFIGQLINTFMQSTGFVIWKLYHFKRDRKPSYMHRVFYHTLLFGILMILIPYFFAPRGEDVFIRVLQEIRVKELPSFMKENLVVTSTVVFSFLNIKLFFSTVLYYPLKRVLKRQSTSELVSVLLAAYFTHSVFYFTFEELRIMGMAVGFGYFTHLFADLFTKGSIPLFYPIPVRWEAYYRPNFPLQISTLEKPVSILNKILVLSVLINSSILFFLFFKNP